MSTNSMYFTTCHVRIECRYQPSPEGTEKISCRKHGNNAQHIRLTHYCQHDQYLSDSLAYTCTCSSLVTLNLTTSGPDGFVYIISPMLSSVTLYYSVVHEHKFVQVFFVYIPYFQTSSRFLTLMHMSDTCTMILLLSGQVLIYCAPYSSNNTLWQQELCYMHNLLN